MTERQATTQDLLERLRARAAMGLPEPGWEQIVWGGIGLESDADDEGRR